MSDHGCARLAAPPRRAHLVDPARDGRLHDAKVRNLIRHAIRHGRRRRAQRSHDIVAIENVHLIGLDLFTERDLVLRRLRRLGVHCIDAPPAAVSTALLNRYLEIKRRELF